MIDRKQKDKEYYEKNKEAIKGRKREKYHAKRGTGWKQWANPLYKARKKFTTRILRLKKRAELKIMVDAYKQEHPCIRCGESDIVVLQFHHRDPKQKDFYISRACGSGLNPQKVLLEIEKCDVVCSNCHIRIHAGMRSNLSGEP